MKPLTVSERQALVEWLEKEVKMIQGMRDEIPFGLDEDGENALLGVMIALKSLKSKPEYYYRNRSDGGCDGPIHESEIEDVRKKSWRPLYPELPVPVMKPVKLPKRYDIAEMFWNPCEVNGRMEENKHGDYLRREEVIAAIKEAGGGVEGEDNAATE